MNETRSKLEGEVDALFKLPLAEFIGARNELARRLTRDGQADDVNFVKALAKPSVSAWAVNQLRWNHSEAFDRLLAADQRFRQAQTSPVAAHTVTTIADMREARREALSHLTELATSLLRDSGHNPTPETVLRISTTLEAVSARASLADAPTPGRLTRDVDPPGFESLASLMAVAGAGATKANEEPTRATPSPKSRPAATPTRQQSSPSDDAEKVRQLKELRRTQIAAAKVSLQDAKRSLTEATSRTQRLDAAQKKAHAGARQAEKELRETEERFKKASAASRAAAERLQSVTADAKDAAKAAEDAERDVEKASRALESLLR